MAKELVSVAELQSGKTGTGINFELDLGPYVDAEQVLLRTDRIDHIRRWGGLGVLTVAAYEGERTEYTPGVSGINADGSAIASAVGKIKKAPTEKTDLNGLAQDPLQVPFTLKDATISINKSEVASRISDMTARDVPREKAWAVELDRSLRRGLRGAAKQYIFDVPKHGGDLHTILVAWYYATAAGLMLETEAEGASYSLSLGAMWYGFKMKSALQRYDLKEWRPSLFPGALQPDRLAAVGLLTATQKLVTAAKEAKN